MVLLPLGQVLATLEEASYRISSHSARTAREMVILCATFGFPPTISDSVEVHSLTKRLHALTVIFFGR
jgi:hypothetical protein